MPALKSNNIYQRYDDFSNVYDLAWKSLTTGLTAEDAAKLGIHITLVGDLVQRTEESLGNNNREGLGLPDPYQGYKNDSRYRYHNGGPDIPYEEDEYNLKNRHNRKPKI